VSGVLSGEFAADLLSLSTEAVRERRDKARQSETDLSYMRRLVQGRLDIVRAELAHRGAGGPPPGPDTLAEILADPNRLAPRGAGAFLDTEPSLADDQQRYLAELTADVDLSNVGACSNVALQTVLGRLQAAEVEISATRREVQQVLDACAADLIRRYRDGTAVVDELLNPQREP
jgi:hypothetical protein